MKKKEIRPWGKTELAMAYTGGTMSARAALQWLNDELCSYPGLLEELERLGYRSRNKRFTLAQIRAIFSAIGSPDE